jgi:hypothetical protein
MRFPYLALLEHHHHSLLAKLPTARPKASAAFAPAPAKQYSAGQSPQGFSGL